MPFRSNLGAGERTGLGEQSGASALYRRPRQRLHGLAAVLPGKGELRYLTVQSMLLYCTVFPTSYYWHICKYWEWYYIRVFAGAFRLAWMQDRARVRLSMLYTKAQLSHYGPKPSSTYLHVRAAV